LHSGLHLQASAYFDQDGRLGEAAPSVIELDMGMRPSSDNVSRETFFAYVT